MNIVKHRVNIFTGLETGLPVRVFDLENIETEFKLDDNYLYISNKGYDFF